MISGDHFVSVCPNLVKNPFIDPTPLVHETRIVVEYEPADHERHSSDKDCPQDESLRGPLDLFRFFARCRLNYLPRPYPFALSGGATPGAQPVDRIERFRLG